MKKLLTILAILSSFSAFAVEEAFDGFPDLMEDGPFITTAAASLLYSRAAVVVVLKNLTYCCVECWQRTPKLPRHLHPHGKKSVHQLLQSVLLLLLPFSRLLRKESAAKPPPDRPDRATTGRRRSRRRHRPRNKCKQRCTGTTSST